jgi:cell filamentation protein
MSKRQQPLKGHEKYGVGQDPYTWPDSDVLRNKLSIKTAYELTEAENQFTRLATQDIKFSSPPYELTYWREIHKQLFFDLYDWAGELRTVVISKGGTNFGLPQGIERQCTLVFGQLAKDKYLVGMAFTSFIEKLAEYYCELNACHPFRDGNGRAQRILFEHIALNCGYQLNFADIAVEQWVNANKHGMACDYRPMVEIMAMSIKGI